MGRRVRLDRFGIGRFEAVAAGGFHRAQHDLQQMQRAGGLKAVGMGRNAAHGVERHGAAQHGVVGITAKICPRLFDFNRLVKGHIGQFRRQCADACGGDAAPLGHSLGRVFGGKVAFGHVLKHSAVALPFGPQIRLHAFAIPRGRRACALINHKGLAFGVLQDQALFRAFGLVHQQRRVGPAREILQIHLARLQQTMQQ